MGTIIDSAEVTGVTSFGVFVRIEDDLEGLIFSSDIDREVMERMKAGDKIKCQITKIDQDQTKIGLSTRC